MSLQGVRVPDGTDAEASPAPAAGLVGSALDDALYYLRHGCIPCAERQFDKARRHGATDEMIAAVRNQAAAPLAASSKPPEDNRHLPDGLGSGPR